MAAPRASAARRGYGLVMAGSAFVMGFSGGAIWQRSGSPLLAIMAAALFVMGMVWVWRTNGDAR